MAAVYERHMSRNDQELARLNGQFNLLTENLGYHIHPTIAARLPENARIADIGTGTANFLFKIAPSYPMSTLHGYDISPSFFPSETPSNMKLSILDARQPVPKELEGTYDLVHVRLITMGLLESDWGPVVANLSRLLKPGGALQWEECNFLAATQHGFYPESTFGAVHTIEKLLLDTFASYFRVGYKTLPDEMKAAGLTEIGMEIVGSDRVKSTLGPYTANSMCVCFQWARSGKDPIPFSKEELDQLEAQAFRDIASGGYVRFDIHVNWGFRPL
ncbi:S-adenosyl-L-methionine-dependent methyltransferase [Penicillium riverlandense]|uniref:S-adenosyl-L-methionine-dependent methyltransferase n=1 Tax=Penicillium riverlandense TaxID=1903569 RepID=UPI002549075B|nr:S-adenosyl-L-methionine-dependent methyltransferase [Penicillium riverlandense]KAJ5814872.1 S-adenosyl-L-methionine-dependent methyltransferase [Penicillium riverlandense]